MTDRDEPKGKKPPGADPILEDILDARIVEQARVKVSEMFSSVFDSLSVDVEERLKNNSAANTHIAKAVTKLTVDMIKMLAEVARDVVPRTPPSRKPDTNDAPPDDRAKPATSDPRPKRKR
jgi:hypothetical protein